MRYTNDANAKELLTGSQTLKDDKAQLAKHGADNCSLPNSYTLCMC